MSSVINTNLRFSYNDGYIIGPRGFSYYISEDSKVLLGSAVTLSDQQHRNNQGVNYLSYRVKHVRVRGENKFYIEDVPDHSMCTVVLYKVPVKYQNGMVVPCATTSGFTQRKNYILYSDPQSVLSWKNVSMPVTVDEDLGVCFAIHDISLSCDKEFVLGPYDVLCLNVFFESDVSMERQDYGTFPLNVTAKIYYDLN